MKEDRAPLARIRRRVLEGRGLDLSHYKESFILRRLGVRQRALGTERLAAYARLLERQPDELERLVGALTVNVSEFFRNPSLFAALERTVLPGLRDGARRAGRRLRLWSAGCAGGEEPYSMAILLDRLGVGGTEAALLGTDIDRTAIERARAGRFEPFRLREVDPATRSRYFEPAGDAGALRIRAGRIPPVRFQVRDVLQPSLQRDLDLVLCRNLLIYVDEALQERLLDTLARALRPGGILVLGRVERLIGATRAIFATLDARERIYRKLDSGAAHAT